MNIDVSRDNNPGEWHAELKTPKPKTIKEILLEAEQKLLKTIKTKIAKGEFSLTENSHKDLDESIRNMEFVVKISEDEYIISFPFHFMTDTTPIKRNSKNPNKLQKTSDIEPDIQSVFIQPKNETFRLEFTRERSYGLLENIHKWLVDDRTAIINLFSEEYQQKLSDAYIALVAESIPKFWPSESEFLSPGNFIFKNDAARFLNSVESEWISEANKITREALNDDNQTKVTPLSSKWDQNGSFPCQEKEGPHTVVSFFQEAESIRGLEVVITWSKNVFPNKQNQENT
jgi:hypothetical protein